jgi:hypothetical protein
MWGEGYKNEWNKNIKRKSELATKVWLKILTRLTMVWNVKSNELKSIDYRSTN